jgi:substrate import-associated zinc metallohydrolase lipoprotein
MKIKKYIKKDMKKIKIYLILFLFLGAAWSCEKEELNSESIFEENTRVTTDFDRWLLTNYTYPYNITVKYLMQDIESSKSYQLVPAEVNKSIAMAKLIKYLWIETYDEVKGIDFTRAYIPKVIHFIGTRGYDASNSQLLGTAESGMKITLYDVNALDPKNVSANDLRTNYLKTMFHEFAHILHQNKNYPVEFEAISHNDYVGADWSASTETEALAYSKGFISRYARKEPNEDFVELISIFVVRGQDYWDARLKNAGTEGADIINQKFSIVKDYLATSWGIDIYELRRVFERRVASINHLDLINL